MKPLMEWSNEPLCTLAVAQQFLTTRDTSKLIYCNIVKMISITDEEETLPPLFRPDHEEKESSNTLPCVPPIPVFA